MSARKKFIQQAIDELESEVREMAEHGEIDLQILSEESILQRAEEIAKHEGREK